MRRGIGTAIAVIALLMLAAPAGAITYGVPDGNGHPEVGALLAPQAYSDGTWAACSGTLISPTVFLTAAHCDLEVSRVAVTFDSTYDSATGTTYWGTWHADPSYTQAQNDPHDIAVVVLDQSVTGITPARLPAAGSLDGLRVGTRFTSVGYGAQSVSIDHGPSFHYADVRYMATGGLLAVNPSWLRISMNPARGDGAPAMATRAGRTSWVPGRPRPTSWPPSPSPATPCAGPPTWTTAWTPPQRERSSASTSRFPSDRWTSAPRHP
jgi:hypothetical protein